MNDVFQYAVSLIDVPVFGYISDDCYTLRLLNFSPLFWLDRIWKRTKVKKTIKCCDKLYVISEIQKNEYERIFHKECKILTKSHVFSQHPPIWQYDHEMLTLIFAGNIGDERWTSLALIANAVVRLNAENLKCTLNIYTSSFFSSTNSF